MVVQSQIKKEFIVNGINAYFTYLADKDLHKEYKSIVYGTFKKGYRVKCLQCLLTIPWSGKM